jgi:hypothetical protein
MNLVKWFRKNNTKLMAVVVIVLMIGFIGGSSLNYILRGRDASNATVAYYGDNIKVKRYDLYQAQQEMEVLKMLQCNSLLKAIQDPFYQSPDFHALVLGELLFAEQRPSQEILAHIEKTIAGNYQYRITNKQIDNLYVKKAGGYYYWYLLNKEAEKAGFKVQKDSSRAMLSQAITNLLKQNYSAYISNVMQKNGLSEDQILTTFGKIFAILGYSHAVSMGEDMTVQQLRHMAAFQGETFNIEFLKLDTEEFAKNVSSPGEQQINEQFEKYKQFYAGEITEVNPYGFGYKLPDRVQLEYMFVKLDDIKKIIKEPTFEEVDQFYINNKERLFQVSTDPNNPDSPKRTQKPSEVEDKIAEYLLQEKIDNKAVTIIQEARTLADGTLQDINDSELDKLSIEERQKKAGSYESIAKSLIAKHKINVIHGLTGELSAEDIQNDKKMSQMYLEGYVNELRLEWVAFAVEPLKLSQLGNYETIKSKMYLSMGPVKDKSASDDIVAIVRVVKAVKASVPESVSLEYSKKAIVYDPNKADAKKETFVVKEKVTTDLKRLAAMGITKSKANEFIEMASADQQNWDNVIEKFNELYGTSEPNDPNNAQSKQVKDANNVTFKLMNRSSLPRYSKEILDTINLHNQGNPDSARVKNLYKKEEMFRDKLFALMPQDSNAPEFKPVIVEFLPDLSYYIIKSISVNPLWKENYERMKAMNSYRDEHFKSQSLAFEHFNPENIFKRMNFKYIEDSETEEKAEPNKVE